MTVQYLSRAAVAAAGGDDPRFYMQAVRRALVAHADGVTVLPRKTYLRPPWARHQADRIIAMPAFVAGGEPAVGLKWIASRHDNPQHGLPRASGVILLNDPDTLRVTAILEGGLISAMRTAAVSAVAADVLASTRFPLAVIGCGELARRHVETLLVNDSEGELRLFDLDSTSAERAAAWVSARWASTDVRVCADARDAVVGAAIVVTCTTARESYIEADWLAPGVFVSHVSLMDLTVGALEAVDKLVVDDLDECRGRNKVLDLVLQRAGGQGDHVIHATLGEVLAGRRPARETDDERIVLNAIGLGVVDVACAQAVLDRARQQGLVTELEFD